MKLVITDMIFDEFPELVLGVVVLHHIDNSQNRAEITEALRRAEAMLSGKFGSTSVIEHPYIATWREAYRKFGAKPKDYPSSIENLTRRVLNGATIGHINNLVSLYNTISLRYILPVGGEDVDKIVGDVVLTRAGDDEPAVFLLGENVSLTCINMGPRNSLNATMPLKNSSVIKSFPFKLPRCVMPWYILGQNLKSLFPALAVHFFMPASPYTL